MAFCLVGFETFGDVLVKGVELVEKHFYQTGLDYFGNAHC
jgi:hypothetical protein